MTEIPNLAANFISVLMVGALVGVPVAKWLLKKLSEAITSAANAYASTYATIAARIENIERIVEEQKQVTHAVETIKAQIAAAFKNEDYKWNFKKEVYVNLTRSLNGIAYVYTKWAACIQMQRSPMAGVQAKGEELMNGLLEEVDRYSAELNAYAMLAPLAVADEALKAILPYIPIPIIEDKDPELEKKILAQAQRFGSIISDLQIAGRKDLWGMTIPEESLKAMRDQSVQSGAP